MPNSLTGDFDAVLQVSGGVVNRLLASMHQNAYARTDLPSFSHVITLRIGDDQKRDGVRGFVRAQLGAPRIELLHGSTTRFRLEVAVRARYKADPGTTPMAEFIHGAVIADYEMEDVDPSCRGWRGIASQYVWIRVVPDSVQFRGDAFDHTSIFQVVLPVDPNRVNALITRQISLLLMTRFETAPHKVSGRFRRGAIRTLATGGQTAVTTALGLGGGEPAGNIASVNGIFLGGAGFAVALSRDVILRMAEPALAAIRRTNPHIPIHIATGKYNPVPDFDTVYRVSTTNPTVEWHPFSSIVVPFLNVAVGSFAVLKVKFSGSATTDSILPNLTFDVEQDIVLSFDSGAERLILSAGTTTVSPHVGGPFGPAAESAVRQPIANIVKGVAESAAAQAQPSLDAVIGRKSELNGQLRTFDDQAATRFDSAEFINEGMVLRGRVSLTHLRSPETFFERALGEDMYTAFQSWIPGGRIDQFRWSWRWLAGGKPEGGTSGNVSNDDVFVLRRPEIRRSRWGGVLASLTDTIPLPGLDGRGTICLEISGVQTESGSGALVPVTSRTLCRNFGLSLYVYANGSLLLRSWQEPELSQTVPFPELAVIDARTLGGAPANTLVLSVGERWDRRAGELLGEALERSRREDAGLGVLVLFGDNNLAHAGRDVVAEIEEWGRRWGTPVLVNEDVNGGWTAALGLPEGREAWRLVSPTGGVTWMSDQRPEARELTAAFDECLRPSPPSPLVPVRTNVSLGLGVSAKALHPGYADLLERSPCPLIPLGRLDVRQTVLGFAVAGSASSTGKLQQLNALLDRTGEAPPFVLAVATGSNAAQAQRLQDELCLRFPVLPDESGFITRNFGIGLWPTSVTLDQSGIVTAIDEGFHRQSDCGRAE